MTGTADLSGRLVLVAGASGGTGQHLLRLLIRSGARVRALSRSAATVDRLSSTPGVTEAMVGDLLEDHDCREAVTRVDAVLCAVGPATDPRSLFFGDLVDSGGSPRLIRAAQDAGVDHFVYTSTIGVGDSAAGMGAFDRMILRRSLTAKGRAEEELRQARMAHTILRPARLTNDGASGDVLVSTGGRTTSGKISRIDVARLMVSALATPAARDRTFEIVDRRRARGAVAEADIAWAPVEA